MLLHLPFITYRHHALLTESVDISVETTIDFAGKKRLADFTSTYHAGIYGFTSLETRDRFISLCNRQGTETEIAYPCSAQGATEAVVIDITNERLEEHRAPSHQVDDENLSEIMERLNQLSELINRRLQNGKECKEDGNRKRGKGSRGAAKGTKGNRSRNG